MEKICKNCKSSNSILYGLKGWVECRTVKEYVSFSEGQLPIFKEDFGCNLFEENNEDDLSLRIPARGITNGVPHDMIGGNGPVE